jgi:hypothetical protein
MERLENTIVRRGGRTASNWYETIRDVAVGKTDKEMLVSFTISSKGTGYTDLQVEVKPADFRKMIDVMCAVDQQAMVEAMLIKLTKALVSRASRYRAFERDGEMRVLHAARSKLRSKPRNENEREQMIYDAISEIIFPEQEELNKSISAAIRG